MDRTKLIQIATAALHFMAVVAKASKNNIDDALVSFLLANEERIGWLIDWIWPDGNIDDAIGTDSLPLLTGDHPLAYQADREAFLFGDLERIAGGLRGFGKLFKNLDPATLASLLSLLNMLRKAAG